MPKHIKNNNNPNSRRFNADFDKSVNAPVSFALPFTYKSTDKISRVKSSRTQKTQNRVNTQSSQFSRQTKNQSRTNVRTSQQTRQTSQNLAQSPNLSRTRAQNLTSRTSVGTRRATPPATHRKTNASQLSQNRSANTARTRSTQTDRTPRTTTRTDHPPRTKGAHAKHSHQSTKDNFTFSPLTAVSNTLTQAKNAKSNNGFSGSGNIFSKLPLIIAGVILILIVVGVVNIFTYPNIYSGVKVGDVDVSGMTREAATQAITDYYSPRIQNTKIRVFAGEEGRENFYNGEGNNEEIAEQVSAQEADANVNYWDADSSTLGVSIDAESLSEQAFNIGRDNGGITGRISAQLFGKKLQVKLNFDSSALDKFVTTANKTLGFERLDWGVEVRDGVAQITDGYDGEEVNSNTLCNDFTNAFTQGGDSQEIIAKAENAPVRITQEQAQNTANEINNAIKGGIVITYGDKSQAYTNAQVGEWVQTTKEQTSNDNSSEGNTDYNSDGTWKLTPSISTKNFGTSFYADFQTTIDNAGLQVTFDVQGGNVSVNTNGSGVVPHITDAVSQLNATLFQENPDANASTQPTIQVQSGSVPESLTFEEAKEMQVVTEISTYTTTFSNSSGTEARNSNIRLGASFLNNTVCSANGGTWSFNGIVGDTTQDKGYQAAGSIAEGEYVDTYGGGICQVATTVFNALYESCYKITERHAHSLYISSYPAGRDAAISWSDLDLTWANETSSDVLMVTSADDTSVTVSLYSTPQTFSVESELGDWEEGSKYTTVVKEDENLAKGYSYVKTTGSDGSKISVTRTVYDANKQILYTNEFDSTYEPKNKVIVCGPGTTVDTSSS